jgi:MFS family permease
MATMTGASDAGPTSAAPQVDDVARWRRILVILILLTGGVKSTLAFTAVVPGLQLIAAEFHGATDSILSAQFVITLAPIGMALAGLIAGLFVRTSNLRSTMFVALGVSTVAGLMPLVIHNYTLLLVTRFILGFSAVVADVAMTSVLAAYFTGGLRSKLIGFRQSISHVSTVITMLASGWLAQHYGWRASSLLFVIPGILLLLAFIAFDRPISMEQRKEEGAQLSLVQLLPLLLLSLIMALGHAMPHYQMPFLLKENGITDAELVSYVPALSAGVSILSALVFGFVYSRFGFATLVAAATLMGIGFIGSGLATSYEMILFFIVIEGVGAGWTMPFFLTRILDRVTTAQRNHAVGLTLASLFIGQFMNPFVTKPIRDAVGLHATFVVMGVALIAITGILGLIVIARAKAKERAPTPA